MTPIEKLLADNKGWLRGSRAEDPGYFERLSPFADRREFPWDRVQ